MVAKRATLSWKEAEALALAVLASTNLLQISEAVTVRRKGQGIVEFYGSRIGLAGTHNQWGRGQAGGSNSCTRASYNTRGDLTTAAISEAHRSWRTSSSFWWHRHPGPNCGGTSSGGLGRPNCGPMVARGVLCSWQGVGKPLPLRCTMPPLGTVGLFEERGQQPVPVVDEDSI